MTWLRYVWVKKKVKCSCRNNTFRSYLGISISFPVENYRGCSLGGNYNWQDSTSGHCGHADTMWHHVPQEVISPQNCRASSPPLSLFSSLLVNQQPAPAALCSSVACRQQTHQSLSLPGSDPASYLNQAGTTRISSLPHKGTKEQVSKPANFGITSSDSYSNSASDQPEELISCASTPQKQLHRSFLGLKEPTHLPWTLVTLTGRSFSIATAHG